MRKIRNILFILLAVCIAVALAACDDGNIPCETHKDENKDGKCDVCNAEVERTPEKCDVCVDENGDEACDVCGACIRCTDVDGDNVCEFCGNLVKQPIEITFTVVAENKAPITSVLADKDIRVVIKQGNTEKFNVKPDSDGKVKVTLVPDEYSLEVIGLPDGWYCEGGNGRYNFSEDKTEYTLTAVDNNPDGSEKKPFFIATKPLETEFDAGETLNYSTKGSKKYLIITNANAKVTYDGVDYLPDSNGFIRVAISPKLDSTGAIDTNSHTPFSITNTSNSANVIKAEFEIQPGSSEDPFDIKLDTAVQTSVSNDNTVFYEWKSPLKGYLVLDSNSDSGYIMMHNITSCEVTSFTDGKGKLYLRVSKDDVVMISVSSKTSTEEEIDLRISAFGGVEQSPLEIDGAASVRLNRNTSDTTKNKVYIKYTGDACELNLLCDGVSVTVNGEAVTGEETNEGTLYKFNANAGDIIVVTCEVAVTEENNSVGIVIS